MPMVLIRISSPASVTYLLHMNVLGNTMGVKPHIGNLVGVSHSLRDNKVIPKGTQQNCIESFHWTILLTINKFISVIQHLPC